MEKLSDRLPTYAKWLAVEAGAAALIGTAVWALSDITWRGGFGGALVAIGVLSLLTGGMSGGGYMTAGGYGILFGSRHNEGWDSTAGEIDRAQDLRGRLMDNLRPRRNATAFWQVIGGLVVLGLGFAVLGVQ